MRAAELTLLLEIASGMVLNCGLKDDEGKRRQRVREEALVSDGGEMPKMHGAICKARRVFVARERVGARQLRVRFHGIVAAVSDGVLGAALECRVVAPVREVAVDRASMLVVQSNGCAAAVELQQRRWERRVNAGGEG